MYRTITAGRIGECSIKPVVVLLESMGFALALKREIT